MIIPPPPLVKILFPLKEIQPMCPIDKRMFEGGSASTPVIDKVRGSLYILSHQGELRSLGLNDGKERWKVSYIDDLKGKRPTWGYSSSPLLSGDMLITVPGGGGSGVVALDPVTGKKKWSFGSDEAAVAVVIMAV